LKLFVGIDVSSQELEACFMNPDGDKLETLTVKKRSLSASSEKPIRIWTRPTVSTPGSSRIAFASAG